MFGVSKKSARLSQWDGCRSGDERSVLAQLLTRPILCRLVIVLVTVLMLTAIVAWHGPSMPYRLGQRPDRDLRVRTYFELVNRPQTERVREEVQGMPMPPGLPTTPAVPPIVERYPPGLLLVRRGESISESQLALLHQEHTAYVQSLSTLDHLRRIVAVFLIFALLAALVVLYVSRFQPALARSPKRILNVCWLVVGAVGIGMLLSRAPWHAVMIPLLMTALVMCMAYNPPFALTLAFTLALVMRLALSEDLGQLLILMSGVGTGVLLLKRVRTRTRLIEVAASAGLVCLIMTVAVGLLTEQSWRLTFSDAARNLLWCLLSGFILGGSLPVLERFFGLVTDVSLLELADSSHPLMQELIRRAPGTYTHSMTVATLAEAAAEAIGANTLLVRVGSYFHDIGKMLKPQYFIENQTGSNRHDQLEPALSTLVIIGHVKDGMALAAQYALPRSVADFIEQHHGTTLVEYFYREALRLQEVNGHGHGELEFTFRYPGPKPQTREIGILMMADAVESASRALSSPTSGSLQKLVHDLLMKRLLDGQFEESGLTLTELRRIEESLCKSLIALYHSRVKYPEEALPAAS